MLALHKWIASVELRCFMLEGTVAELEEVHACLEGQREVARVRKPNAIVDESEDGPELRALECRARWLNSWPWCEGTM